uniref:Uncharacterized protein n=1 Tax=Trichuris muris TaxID=70415 RepID=A0A5S6Q7F3_TRIMR
MSVEGRLRELTGPAEQQPVGATDGRPLPANSGLPILSPSEMTPLKTVEWTPSAREAGGRGVRWQEEPIEKNLGRCCTQGANGWVPLAPNAARAPKVWQNEGTASSRRNSKKGTPLALKKKWAYDKERSFVLSNCRGLGSRNLNITVALRMRRTEKPCSSIQMLES